MNSDSSVGQSPMFRVKICGITNAADAQAVAASGADAVGLNFYAKSARFLMPEAANSVVDALPPEIVKVGLFVNAAADEICGHFDSLELDLIQLHGDETPEFVSRLAGRPVMKAFRVGTQGLSPVYEFIEQTQKLGCRLRAVLVDAFCRGSYGGTGRLADWPAVAEYSQNKKQLRADLPPLVLAGGLTADNVAEAIRAVRPAAVDTASGVESSPGKKDPKAVLSFVQAAKIALTQNC